MKGTAYLLQATLILLWWIGLSVSETFYEAFRYPGFDDKSFQAFFLPDLIVVSVLSVIRAYKESRELNYVILGGFAYASLYCLNATILTQGGYLSTVAMTMGLCYNLFLIGEQRVFKTSGSKNVWWNAFKTLIQIVCVWLITLLILPVWIIKSFDVRILTSEWVRIIAIVLFIGFSILGLYSSYLMVRLGKGTPLPIDQSRRLVVSGPYKFVRNPMAIAGLGQSASISLYLGSVHILVYTLIGGIIWQFVMRPLEENDLVARFGEDYVAYRNQVRCWIPIRRSPTEH